MPAVKAVIAARTGEPSWRNLRPPLEALSEAARADLLADPAIVALLAAQTA
jgi:hypothetical protein